MIIVTNVYPDRLVRLGFSKYDVKVSVPGGPDVPIGKTNDEAEAEVLQAKAQEWCNENR